MTDQTDYQSDRPIEILLVEDNHGDIRLTKEAFNATEQELVLRSVMNGDEAVDRLCEQATQEPDSLPDIALVDLNLPGRDGCEVLKAIRDNSQLEHLPVIILTSSSDRDDIERCYNAQANAYLTKPTSPGDFESLAEKIGQFWCEHAELPPIPA